MSDVTQVDEPEEKTNANWLETSLWVLTWPFITLWSLLTPLTPFRRPNLLKWPLVLISIFSFARFLYYLLTGDATMPIGLGSWVLELWYLWGKFPTFPGPVPIQSVWLVIMGFWAGLSWGYVKLLKDDENREVFPIIHLIAAWDCLFGLILVGWSIW